MQANYEWGIESPQAAIRLKDTGFLRLAEKPACSISDTHLSECSTKKKSTLLGITIVELFRSHTQFLFF